METASLDMITKRPRTPNDQYSCITEEQMKNLKKKSKAGVHFRKEIPVKMPNMRFYMDRFAKNTSQYLFREQPGSNPVCWIGDHWQREPPEQHNTSRFGASLPWGPEKMGSRTYSHFDGEDVYRYLTLDVYSRPLTNVPGLVVQKFGRPGESYYHQRKPHMQTWFGSSHVLNQTNVLEDIHPKSFDEYAQKAQREYVQVLLRRGQWPEYSEYTDRYALKSKVLPHITTLEQKKRHVAMAL